MTDDLSIERIEKALAELGREHRSPAGWEERVLAATRRRRRPARWAALGAAIAAAAALLLWWSVGRRAHDPPSFETQVKAGDGKVVRGGSSAHPGDSLRAAVRGGRHRAIWVYRGEQLVARCPQDGRGTDGRVSCTASEDEVTLAMPFDGLGDYKVVGLHHDEPLPEPGRGYDPDVAAAERADASTSKKEIVVD